jgi:hypothetical protein
MTVFSAVLLLVYMNFDRLIALVSHTYRDYFPSSWPTGYRNQDGLLPVGIAVIYFGVCWLWAGWRRQAYPER